MASEAKLQLLQVWLSQGSVKEKLPKLPWFDSRNSSSAAISVSSNSIRRITHRCRGPALSRYRCSAPSTNRTTWFWNTTVLVAGYCAMALVLRVGNEAMSQIADYIVD